MYVTLSKNRKARVGISHAPFGEATRGTKVWVKVGRKTYEAEAVCSRHDNFCRKTGRKLAAERLLARLREASSVSKEDRRILFSSLCPEYFR